MNTYIIEMPQLDFDIDNEPKVTKVKADRFSIEGQTAIFWTDPGYPVASFIGYKSILTEDSNS